MSSASWDQTVCVWDLTTGEKSHSLKGQGGYVYCSSFDKDGSQLATGGRDQTVRLWDLSKGHETTTIPWQAIGLSFSPDGKSLACAVGQEVRIWDVKARKRMLSLGEHKSQVLSAIYSPDGRQLASCDRGGTVKIWDARTGREISSFHGPPRSEWFLLAHTFCFSPDGQQVASVGQGLVQVRDVVTGQVTRTVRGRSSVSFSPDGHRLATFGPNFCIKVWDTQNGQEVRTLVGHPNSLAVFCLAFSPDGRRLASSNYYNVVKIWDPATGQGLSTLNGHTCGIPSVAFSSDSKRIASASGDISVPGKPSEVIVWDAQTGQELLRLRQKARIYSVAFSPDGRRLAAASDDGTVKIWDGRPVSREEIQEREARPPPPDTEPSQEQLGKNDEASKCYNRAIQCMDMHRRGTRNFVASVRKRKN